jgi:hypothetical protein
MSEFSVLLLIVLAVCLLVAISQVAVMLRVKRDLAQREKLLLELRGEVYALLQCGRGYGDRLKDQQHRLSHIYQRQEALELRGTDEGGCRAAVSMAQRGASVRELIETCGLSRGEAELVRRLHGIT